MFNRRIAITEKNIDILFANALIENLRYGIISLDMMFRQKHTKELYTEDLYYDEYTFYFFHMQSVLAAQGNIWNVLFNTFFDKRIVSQEHVKKLRDVFDIDPKDYPLVGNKKFRNTNEHFDERYWQYCSGLGDLNILRKDTPHAIRNEILSTKHLRTIDIENWIYITYDRKGKRIELDLQKLRAEMYQMLSKLCSLDIRNVSAEQK